MPSYTLSYFNGRGHAEVSRMLFAVADVGYSDKRIGFSEWNQYKNKTVGSTVPVLEIDGKTQIPQTMTIARYLSREFGYHGKNNIEQLKVDFISDSFYDILNDYMKWYHEKDADLKIELRLKFDDTCRKILPHMEKTLELNDGGNGWFVGEQMLMCDLMCYATLESPLNENPALLTDYPKLQALRSRITSHPKMIPYLKKRPKTNF